MDKFTEVLTRKIGDPNEIFGNEKDTIEVFKDHSKTLNDSDIEEFNEELNDGDKRVQDSILNGIEQDFTATDRVTDVVTEDLMEDLPEEIEKFDQVNKQKEVENKENNTDKDSNRNLIAVDDKEVVQEKEGVKVITPKMRR